MDKTKIIVDLFKTGNKASQIAQVVGLTPQRVNQILKKEGLKETNFNYSPKITKDISETILSLHENGKNVTEISRILTGITAPAIRAFLKKNGLVANLTVVDRERPCVICSRSFTPPYSDGIKKDKYKTCSSECLGKHLSNIKTKYNSEEISEVTSLKMNGIPNKQIVSLTGVDINKVKEIIKEKELYLSPEKAQQNAYEAKLAKDPLCMQKMRQGHMDFTEEEFKDRILLLEKDVIDGKGTVSGLAPKFGLVPASVVEFLKRNDKKHLIGIHDSTPQSELHEFISSVIKESVEYNTRKIISPLELDIYIPSINLAVEYCGLYWHSDEFKDKKYHYNKMKLCNEKGIRLITIFEDEWLERKAQVKNFILSVLNKNTIRLMARKTELKQASNAEASKFLEETHIQGSPKFEIAFGLYHNNEIQAIITGNKHHRQGFEDVFVLNRLAFRSNVSISGGSSKLLKALLNYTKEKGYTKVISWSDSRWSEGNVYKKLGFELNEELLPDYSYIQKQTRISKQSCQKKHLIKKGAVGETETEMAISLDLKRIWDCGKKRWSYKL